jgi:ketosteroid isomerase-like protein
MSVRTAQRADLESAREAHVAALNAGDADAWVACFAADAVQMPPNSPPNVGTEDIRAWSGGLLAAFRAEFSLVPDGIQEAGTDAAIESGAYSIVLTPRSGGEPIRDEGKYVTIYRRESDGWVMTRDIWNSNQPHPAS